MEEEKRPFKMPTAFLEGWEEMRSAALLLKEGKGQSVKTRRKGKIVRYVKPSQAATKHNCEEVKYESEQ